MTHRPEAPRPGAGGGRRLRRSGPGRRDRTGARGRAPPAWALPAAFPAVLRILDRGRMDRDACVRASRDASNPRRRPGRGRPPSRRPVWADAAPPGLWSRSGPRPSAVGSEGALGIVTEAWLRVQPRRGGVLRRSAVRHIRFGAEADASDRTDGPLSVELPLARSGRSGRLRSGRRGAHGPARRVRIGGPPEEAPLALAWRHAATSVERWPRPTFGGPAPGDAPTEGGEAVDAWRGTFLSAPYLRDVLVSMGIISDTFETAVTWDRFDARTEP